MKSKWLFFPDVLLVLVLCLTCERHELQQMREKGHAVLAKANSTPESEEKTYAPNTEKQKSWKEFIQTANGSSFRLIMYHRKE